MRNRTKAAESALGRQAYGMTMRKVLLRSIAVLSLGIGPTASALALGVTEVVSSVVGMVMSPPPIVPDRR